MFSDEQILAALTWHCVCAELNSVDMSAWARREVGVARCVF
jgi:hypothetical protein